MQDHRKNLNCFVILIFLIQGFFLKLTSIKKACRKSIRDNKFGIDDFFETLYEIGYVKNQLLNTH